MKKHIYKILFFCVILLLSLTNQIFARSYDDYNLFLNDFLKLDYNRTTAYSINECMLKYPYCAIVLEKGDYYPLNSLNGKEYGGLYVGTGIFDFNIPILEERKEIQRNFQIEQINDEIEWIFFFSADSTHYDILSRGEKIKFPFKVNSTPLNVFITSNVSMNKNIVEGSTSKAILEGDFSRFTFNVIKVKGISEPLVYQISPEYNEAIQLHRTFENTKGYYAKMISKYFDADYRNIPIIKESDANPIRPIKYDLKLDFDANLETDVIAEIECEATTYTGNWIITNAFPQADIDEVKINNESVDYYFNKYYPILFLYIKKPFEKGEKFKLSMKYSGKILYKMSGITLLRNADYWYPKFGNNQKAIFDIYSKTSSKKNKFKSVGEEIENKVEDGYFISHWRTKEPILSASFFIAPYLEEKLKTKDNKTVNILHYQEADKDVITQNVSTMLEFAKLIFGNLESPNINMIFNASPVYNFSPGFLMLNNSFIYYYNLDFGFEIAKLYFAENFMLRTDRDFWLLNGLGQYLGILYTQNVAKKNDLVESGMKESIDFQFLTPNTITSKIKKYPSTLVQNRNQLTDLDPENLYRYSNYIVAGAASNNYNQAEYENSVSTTPLYRIKESFDKSGWIFHMIRYIMHGFKNNDDAAFITVIKEFFTKYKGKTISTEDFINHLETLTDYDFSWFFDQWLKSYDLPIYKYAYKIEEKNGKYICKIKMKQEEVPASFKMLIPIAIKSGEEILDVNRIYFSGGDTISFDLNPTDKKPKEIIFNYKNAVLCKHIEVSWDKL